MAGRRRSKGWLAKCAVRAMPSLPIPFYARPSSLKRTKNRDVSLPLARS
jgi:hypothetical protein